MKKLFTKEALQHAVENWRDLFVGDCQLFVIQMFAETSCWPEIFTRIGSWGKLSILMRDHSVEKRNKKGGYVKLIHHDDAIPGYETKVLEIRKSTNTKPYLFHINIFPAFCI